MIFLLHRLLINYNQFAFRRLTYDDLQGKMEATLDLANGCRTGEERPAHASVRNNHRIKALVMWGFPREEQKKTSILKEHYRMILGTPENDLFSLFFFFFGELWLGEMLTVK